MLFMYKRVGLAAERLFCNLLSDWWQQAFNVYRKQDLAVSAPFYHAPMSSGAVYVYSGKQVRAYERYFHVCCFL